MEKETTSQTKKEVERIDELTRLLLNELSVAYAKSITFNYQVETVNGFINEIRTLAKLKPLVEHPREWR